MNNNLLQIKFKQRLNKLASFDYDNIECWMIQEAFNKAQLEWTRRQIHGLNSKKETAEQSINIIDDLQILLGEADLAGTKRNKYFETANIPLNYLHFARVSANGKTECCPKVKLSVYQAEEANVDVLISDEFKGPSYDWGETFCTIIGDKIRIYTNNKFDVEDIKLVYYRKPREVQFNGCVNPSTGSAYTTDVICELKDDICEIIIDEAAAILAGDMESMIQYQREVQNAQRNS
jgi:hypothetical protein